MAKADPVEGLLNPSLRVSRVLAACARCRTAKIKCDGKLPACSACDRSGNTDSCSAANDEFARGKERSYVAALEAASERLQHKVDELKAKSPMKLQAQDLQPVRTPVLGRGTSGRERWEASVVDELVEDLGFLSVNATARDFHGFTSTMSFARLLLSASIVKELPHQTNSSLPPRYATTPQIQHYLHNIYVLLPFISETELLSSVSRVYQDRGKLASPLDHWNVRMVLAISGAASSQVKGDANYQTAVLHVSVAMQYASKVLHPGSLAGVQAIILLVLYAMVDPEHFRAWYLIGMAARVMVDLGIHVEPSSDLKVPKQALETRRRVFYSVFALDRAISMSLERAFAFTDDSAPEVHLPVDTDRRLAPQLFLQSIKPALYLFDIRRVQSVYYQSSRGAARTEWDPSYATSYTTSVLRDVHAWHSEIPNTLSQCHILYFRLESLYTEILVLSPSIRRPLAIINKRQRLLLFELVFQFVDQAQAVSQDTSWHAFFTYVDICRVTFVARQILNLLRIDFDYLLCGGMSLSDTSYNQRSKTPLDNCNRTIACLQKMAEILDFARQRWDMDGFRSKFEQESAVLMGKLRNRQSELSNVQNLTAHPKLGRQITPVSGNVAKMKSPSLQDNYAFGIPQLLNPIPNFPVQSTSQDRPQYFRGPSSGHYE